MRQTEHLGMNRTGIQMSPVDSKAMQDVEPGMLADDGGDDSALAEMRNSYIADADALGSIPLPGTFTGAVNMGRQMLKGDSPQILATSCSFPTPLNRSAATRPRRRRAQTWRASNRWDWCRC